MTTQHKASVLAAISVCLLGLASSVALAQAQFYRGKTITIISGQQPGGSGEARLRAMLPYLRKHIPGQPNVMVEYMAGGGGRKAANYIYRTARAAGLTMGFPPGGFIMAAVLNETGVDYDLADANLAERIRRGYQEAAAQL
ncbi:MAG: hypothetical protein FJ145_01310 [Deltaproteobacteria bacterium]|nr:hypothetical protein [Deltaproteobacteria bacterium]